jgi:hypothetical protein
MSERGCMADLLPGAVAGRSKVSEEARERMRDNREIALEGAEGAGALGLAEIRCRSLL